MMQTANRSEFLLAEKEKKIENKRKLDANTQTRVCVDAEFCADVTFHTSNVRTRTHTHTHTHTHLLIRGQRERVAQQCGSVVAEQHKLGFYRLLVFPTRLSE